jgi:hypothetical protein
MEGIQTKKSPLSASAVPRYLQVDWEKQSPQTSFEGVCVNSRHHDPRRAWKGSPESRLMTPDPADPLDPLGPVDPVDPGMSSKSAESDGVLFKNTFGTPQNGSPNRFLVRTLSIYTKSLISVKIHINSKKKRFQ